MKVLIFGAAGMLGHKLMQHFGKRFDTYGTLRRRFDTVERFGIFDRTKIIENVDVIDQASAERAISEIRPEVVINAIGIVKQVSSAKDVITTLEINSIFPHRLAQLSVVHGFRLICISTDCVFNGENGGRMETEVPDAADLYGRSKIIGEITDENCLTIRSSIIGRQLTTSHGFIEWFLSNRGQTVNGYASAIYSGFPTVVFADIIANLIANHKELSGLFHISSTPINKFELLELVNKYYGAGITLAPSDEPKIDRSLDGRKFSEATGFSPQPWPEMVKLMAEDATPYNDFRQ